LSLIEVSSQPARLASGAPPPAAIRDSRHAALANPPGNHEGYRTLRCRANKISNRLLTAVYKTSLQQPVRCTFAYMPRPARFSAAR
jgi:hypothetical protein